MKILSILLILFFSFSAFGQTKTVKELEYIRDYNRREYRRYLSRAAASAVIIAALWWWLAGW